MTCASVGRADASADHLICASEKELAAQIEAAEVESAAPERARAQSLARLRALRAVWLASSQR